MVRLLAAPRVQLSVIATTEWPQ